MDETILKRLQELYKIRQSHVVLEKVDLLKVKEIYNAKYEESERIRSTTPNLAESGKSRSKAYGCEALSRRSRHYVCYVCLQKFKSNFDLEAHKAIHDSDENLENVINPVVETPLELTDASPNTSHTVVSSETRMSNADNSSENAYVFRCITCSCYFKTGFNLFVHIRENKGKACKFHCDKCNKLFKYPVEFSQHIAHHLGNIVRRKRKLANEKANYKLDYKIDTIENRPILNSLNTSPGQYNCVLCLKTFEDCFQLKRHLILGHKLKEPQVTTLLNEQVAKKSVSIDKVSDSTDKLPDQTDKLADETDNLSNQTNKLPGCTDKVADTTDKLPDPRSDNSANKQSTEKDTHEGGTCQNVIDKLTCNMCYDEFSSKQELEDHIKLHLELNKPKERVEEDGNVPSTSGTHDVIVIDDEEEAPKTQQVQISEKNFKHKRKLKIKEVKVIKPNGQSLLKANLLKSKYSPFLFSTRPLQIVKSVTSVNPPSMVLLSPQQDNKNIKLLKTGPQSFQLCIDSTSPSGSNVNVATSLGSLNVQKTIPSASFLSLSTGTQIPHGPLINVQHNNKTNALSTTQPIVTPNLTSIKTLTPPNLSTTKFQIKPYVPKLVRHALQKGRQNVASSLYTSEADVDCENVVVMSPANENTSNDSESDVTSEEPNSNKITEIPSKDFIESTCRNKSSTNNNLLNKTASDKDLSKADVNVEKNIDGSTCTSSNICKDIALNINTCAGSVTISESNVINHTVSSDAPNAPSVSDGPTNNINAIVTGLPEVDSTNGSEPQNTDAGSESDDPGLVIDEGSTNTDITSVPSDEISGTDGVSTQQPKIFVRKLSDLLEPQKLEKVLAEEKKKRLREKKCTDCNLVFNRHKSLRLHLKKRLSCIRCDYQTCKVSQMKTHYQTKHDLYLCVRCRKIAENGYELYKHIVDVHTCIVCEHTVNSLETHKEKCTGKPKQPKGK